MPFRNFLFPRSVRKLFFYSTRQRRKSVSSVKHLVWLYCNRKFYFPRLIFPSCKKCIWNCCRFEENTWEEFRWKRRSYFRNWFREREQSVSASGWKFVISADFSYGTSISFPFEANVRKPRGETSTPKLNFHYQCSFWYGYLQVPVSHFSMPIPSNVQQTK